MSATGLGVSTGLLFCSPAAFAQSVTGTGDTYPSPIVSPVWNTDGNIFIGYDHVGTLTILNGGKVSNYHGIIGRTSASPSTVTVRGAGSTWTNTGDLTIGGRGGGTGVLNISDGGKVYSNRVEIGMERQSDGTVTVSGSGSSLTSTGSLWVSTNSYSKGKVVISDGGTISAGSVNIGITAATSGEMTVDGANSRLTSSGILTVGNQGRGSMTILNGGTVSNTNGEIGFWRGSNSTVTVDGAGSSWINNGKLDIGSSGDGTLTVSGGGTVSSTHASFATHTHSWATMTVTGANSTWNNTGALVIGLSGVGRLTIANGAKVYNRGDIRMAVASNSAATVVVRGAGSVWGNEGELTIGEASAATLTISEGAKVYNTSATIGYTYLSNGTVTVTGAGSDWTNSGELLVGYQGGGNLTISDGGTVSSGTAGVGGMLGASNDTVNVTGTGSTWTNSGDLVVGKSGSGRLLIANGGTVKTGNITAVPQAGVINLQAGGTLQTHNINYTGNAFNLTGGHLIATGTVSGNFPTAGSGSVTLTGKEARWENSGADFTVGFSGAGALNIEDGGRLSNFAGYIGRNTNSDNTATVTGDGSVWTSSGMLYVGLHGNGVLNITNAGHVLNTSAVIGRHTGATGTATVTGQNSRWTNSDDLHVGLDGIGNLTVSDRALVSVGGTFRIYDGSSMELSGGATLQTHHINLGSNTFNLNNGHVIATGTVRGNLPTHGSGSITLTGAEANWENNNADITVGLSGNSILNIENGGRVSNSVSYIGRNANSHGTATVTGDGSAWTISDMLYAGFNGSAVLNITNAGQISSTNSVIGRHAGATGTVTVTGQNSEWTNSGDMHVGYDGIGRLTVSDNAALTLGGTLAIKAGSSLELNRGGTLRLSSDNASVTGTGNALTLGTGGGIIDTQSRTVTLLAPVSGAGSLTKIGTGTLTFRGNNTYTGVTTINAGVLRLEGNSSSSRFNIAAGTVLELAPTTDGYSGSTTFTGSGTLRKTGNVAARWTHASATFALDEGSLIDVQEGTFVGGSNDNEVWTNNKSALHVAAGAIFNGVEANVRVDALSGAGIIRSGFSIASYRHFAFGVANGSGVFSGSLESGNYLKAGTGTQTLTGVNAYTGTTTISAGTLLVSGSGASISRTSAVTIGDSSEADATLAVSNGATINTGNTTLAHANATLTVSNGATANIGNITFDHANATINLLSGSTLQTTDFDFSKGTFNFASGHLIASGVLTGNLRIPDASSLTLTGAAARWENPNTPLTIGSATQSALHIRNGGRVRNSLGSIGEQAASTGTATVDGKNSLWTNDSDLYIGQSGTGTLTVSNGGNVTNALGSIGRQADAIGTATVDGENSLWANNYDLYIGQSGTGTLTVSNGGNVTNALGSIGRQAGATGTATVDGENSLWANSSHLYVGQSGTGTLTVSNGARVTNNMGYVGEQAGSTGTVTVTGPDSTWSNGSFLLVGQAGTGTLTIANGGKVSNGTAAYIGQYVDSSGTVTVTGKGSAWDSVSSLYVGQSGNGTLTISDGGTVSSSTGYIGSQGNSNASVTVIGIDSNWTNSGDLVLAGTAISRATTGIGSLTIADGGTVSVGGTTRVHRNGTLNLNEGGVLRTHHLNFTDGTFNFGGGTLIASGTLTGDLEISEQATLSGTPTIVGNVVNAGTAAPGNSPGVMTVEGDFTQTESGRLVIEIGGTTQGAEYDFLSVSGHLQLGGTLELIKLGTFELTAGDQFQLFAFESVSGSFTAIEAFDPGNDLFWDFSRLHTEGLLLLTAVPEPSTYAALTGIALLALVVVRRARRKA